MRPVLPVELFTFFNRVWDINQDRNVERPYFNKLHLIIIFFLNIHSISFITDATCSVCINYNRYLIVSRDYWSVILSYAHIVIKCNAASAEQRILHQIVQLIVLKRFLTSVNLLLCINSFWFIIILLLFFSL